MNKVFATIALLLSVGPIWSQANPPGIISEHGFRMILHRVSGTPKATFDDEVLMTVEVHVGDTIMQSSRTFAPEGYKVKIPSEAEFKNSPTAPVLFDAAIRMGVGDSITAFMQLDSFLRSSLPRRLRKATLVRYELTLNAIKSGSGARQMREEAKQNLPNIKAAAIKTATDYQAGMLNLRTLPSGLKYFIVDPGEGSAIVKNEKVAAHYFGVLTNGTPFDNSFEHGDPLVFQAGVGQMIQGFDEGVLLLRHGSKAYLFVPPGLAYGTQPNGQIPPNSELIFYIEIF